MALEQFIDIYSFTIEVIIEVLGFCNLFSVKLKDTHHPYIAIAAYIISGTLLPFIFPDVFVWVLLFPLSYLMYRYIFKKTPQELILAYFIIFMYIGFIEQIYVLIFTKIQIESWQIQALVGSTASSITALILLKVLPINKLYNYIINGSLYIRISIFNVGILYLIKLYLSKYTNYDTTVMIPLLISFGMVVIITDYLLIRQQKTIIRQQESLESFQTYEPMMDSLIEDIRRRQHEYANELNALNMIVCSYDDYESLSNALKEHAQHIMSDFHSTDLVHLNMKVLAGFLHSKISLAESMSKHLCISICNYNLHSRMPEYELIKIVGILIDNALEAIDTDDTVKVEIDSDGEQLTFSTLNKGPLLTPKLRTDMLKPGYTTKADTLSECKSSPSKRGFGLANAMQLLNTYDGELYIENPVSGSDTFIRFEFIV